MDTRLEILLEGHLEGRLSKLERRELAGYLEDPAFEGQLSQLLGRAYVAHVHVGQGLSVPEQQVMLSDIYGEGPVVRRMVPGWKWMAAAVAVLFFLGMGIYFYADRMQTETLKVQLAGVRPGSQGATLTLGDGSKLSLSEAGVGHLAQQSGVRVSKDADGSLVYEIEGMDGVPGELNELSTGRGQTYRVRLPDGSVVWLNAGSSLKYRSDLHRQLERRVQLSGEGYFEVAKDVAHPFVVESGMQRVQVLGTHFNVSAYGGERIATTLLEGRVKVLAMGVKPQERVLLPGQQALLSGNVLSLRNVEARDVAAWKDGVFVFDDEGLPEVMAKLSRWYNIVIDYSGADATKRFGGTVSRYEDMATVLEKLEQTGGVHFRVEERRVVVTR